MCRYISMEHLSNVLLFVSKLFIPMFTEPPQGQAVSGQAFHHPQSGLFHRECSFTAPFRAGVFLSARYDNAVDFFF